MEGVDRVTVTFVKTFWYPLCRENVKNNTFLLVPLAMYYDGITHITCIREVLNGQESGLHSSGTLSQHYMAP